jgi:primosomal protein N'
MFYTCRVCHWTAEVAKVPKQCERCTARDVRKLSTEEALDLLDAFEIQLCEACTRVHTR